jgi:hypothetical protein
VALDTAAMLCVAWVLTVAATCAWVTLELLVWTAPEARATCPCTWLPRFLAVVWAALPFGVLGAPRCWRAIVNVFVAPTTVWTASDALVDPLLLLTLARADWNAETHVAAALQYAVAQSAAEVVELLPPPPLPPQPAKSKQTSANGAARKARRTTSATLQDAPPTQKRSPA